jgi:hypothetical protein
VSGKQRSKRRTKTRTPRRDRVRSAVRRRSTSAAVRQLDTAAFVAIGLDRATIEKAPPPALAFHFGLVEHGFEARLFVDGQYITSVCRDFSGNHDVDKIRQGLYEKIVTAISEWRAAL